MHKSSYSILRCMDCGTPDIAPRSLCLKCGSNRFSGEPVNGSGTLVSWTVIRKPPAAFKEIGVFAVAVVRLQEGVQITGRLDRFDPPPALGAKVRIGETIGGVPVFSLEGT